MTFSILWAIFLFVIPFFLSSPIFVCFVLSSFVILIFTANMPGMTIALQAVSAIHSFSLVAIPFFILLGYIMVESKAVTSLFDLVRVFIGSFKAGLGMAVIMGSALFGTMCGSGVATAVAMSSAGGPELIKSGYSKDRAAAIAGAAGCLGFMIPPSVVGVILAEVTQTSVADLFAAIVIPGFVIALIECVTCYLTCRNVPTIKREPKSNWSEKRKAMYRALPAFIIPATLFVVIYGGIATPTEASAIACFAAFLVGVFFYRQLTWGGVKRALKDTIISSSTIFCIIFGAVLFGRSLAVLGLPQAIASWATGSSLHPVLFLFAFSIIFLILGTFLDIFALLYICLPPVLPAVAALGIDPIHFGVVFLVAAFVGQITPPVCITLYAATTPLDADVTKTIRFAMPYLGAVVLSLILVILFPVLSLFMVGLTN